MEILNIIFKMIWLMLPAYLANPAAALSVKFTGEGLPIDLERKISNKRILGDGKTYKGFFSGVIFGILVAIIQNQINIVFFKRNLSDIYIIVIRQPTSRSYAG